MRESGHNPGAQSDPWKRLPNFYSQIGSGQVLRARNASFSTGARLCAVASNFPPAVPSSYPVNSIAPTGPRNRSLHDKRIVCFFHAA